MKSPDNRPHNRPGKRRTAALIGLLAAMLGALLIVPAVLAKKPMTKGLKSGDIEVSAEAINHFSKVNPLQSNFGKLTFLGGLKLSSKVKQFGGWSDIAIDPDGGRFLAVSDDGVWLSGGIIYNGSKPIGLRRSRLGPLRALSGRPLRGKRERDAEGLVLIDGRIGRGNLLISFERIHRIGQFRSGRAGVVGPSRYIKLPAKARRLRRNKGLETVALIRGGPMAGAIVTFAERPRSGRGNRSGWILHKGRTRSIELEDIGDYDVTSAAGLPDGSLLILERRFKLKEWFKGMRIRLRRIPAAELSAGRVVRGEILLQANSSHEVDNMEGLAVHAGPDGQSIITMISDDNFNKFLQKTVLLQFSLAARHLARVGARPAQVE